MILIDFPGSISLMKTAGDIARYIVITINL